MGRRWQLLARPAAANLPRVQGAAVQQDQQTHSGTRHVPAARCTALLRAHPAGRPPCAALLRIGTDCFARAYCQHFLHQYPARLDRMLSLKLLQLLEDQPVR